MASRRVRYVIHSENLAYNEDKTKFPEWSAEGYRYVKVDYDSGELNTWSGASSIGVNEQRFMPSEFFPLVSSSDVPSKTPNGFPSITNNIKRVYLLQGCTLTVKTSPGYEFAGWRYGGVTVSGEYFCGFVRNNSPYYSQISLTYNLNGEQVGVASALISPSSTFNGDIERLADLNGYPRYKLNVNPNVFDGISNWDFFLVAVERYIMRTVNFDSRGGSELSSLICKGTNGIVLPTPTRNGYDFKGWYSDSNLTEFIGNGGASYYAPQDNVTLYAKWQAKKINVTLDPQGGSILAPNTSYITVEFSNTYGAYTPLPIPVKTGYKFDGWYTAVTGGTKVENATTVTNYNSHTLYAHWVGIKITLKLKGKYVNATQDEKDLTPEECGFRIEIRRTSTNSSLAVQQNNSNTIEYSGASEQLSILITNVSDEKAKFWKPTGVPVIEGTDIVYKSFYNITIEAGKEESLDYWIEEKRLFSVDLEYDEEILKDESASVLSTIPDKDGKYLEGTVLSISFKTKFGYVNGSARVIDTATNTALMTEIDKGDTSKSVSINLEYSLKENIKIVCEAEKAKFPIFKKTNKSSLFVKEIHVKDSSGNELEEVILGDEVALSAEMIDGYSLNSWCVGGWNASAENFTNGFSAKYRGNNVTILLSEDLLKQDGFGVEAISSCSISFKVNHIDNRDDKSIPIEENCTVKATYKEWIGGSYVSSANLKEMNIDTYNGHEFVFFLNLNVLKEDPSKRWIFVSLTDDKGNSVEDYEILQQETGEIKFRTVSTENKTFVLNVSNTITVHDLVIQFLDEDNNYSNIKPQIEWVESDLEYKDKSIDGNNLKIQYEWTKTIKFTFDEYIVVGSKELFFVEARCKGKVFNTSSFELFHDSDIQMNVVYGTTGTRKVEVSFVDGSDRSKGEIYLDDMSSETSSIPLQIEKEKKEKVVLNAMPKNGYVFAGWFDDASGLGTPIYINPQIEYILMANKYFYAKFVKNPNAVYEWEGSDENKMMKWKSRTYVASKPFNPSACRIDALKYPISSMKVEMFSAPDTEASEITEIKNIKTQGARRLPVRRMERYMQISVENDAEVDSIVIGTSMGGLAV